MILNIVTDTMSLSYPLSTTAPPPPPRPHTPHPKENPVSVYSLHGTLTPRLKLLSEATEILNTHTHTHTHPPTHTHTHTHRILGNKILNERR